MVTKSCVIILVAVVALVTLATSTTAVGANRALVAATWLRSPARALAALDCNCTPSAAHIAPYRAVLSRLAMRCQESQGRLGYISKTATEILEQNGYRRTNLWLLREVDRRTPSRVSKQQPCRYVFVLVVSSV